MPELHNKTVKEKTKHPGRTLILKLVILHNKRYLLKTFMVGDSVDCIYIEVHQTHSLPAVLQCAS